MSSKARTLVKGSVLRIVEFFSGAAVGLILMPFIIHALGDRMYGLWVFIGSFLGYYGLMDFGLNSAIQRFISRAIGKKDKHEVNKVINTAFFLFTIIGLISLIVSMILAFFLPLLIKNITEIILFRKIILILGLNFALGFPLRVFSGVLSADIRYDLSTIVELVKLAFRTILIIFFLKHGYGIMALAWITLIIDIGGYIAKYSIVRSLYAYVHLSIKLVDKSIIKPLFGYSVYSFIAQIADQLRFNIDNLVITMFVGLSSVTVYSIGVRLVTYLGQIVAAVVGMLVPVFSQYEAKNDYKAIREKFLFLTKISSYFAILIGGSLIIFANAFIRRWIGTEYSYSYKILLVLVIPSVFALMQSPSVQLLYGISKHKFFAYSNALEGLLNLVLSIILVQKYGIIGVAIGTAVPMMLIKIFVQPIFTCKCINLSLVQYYYTLLPIILKSAIVLLGFWFLLHRYIEPNYVNLLIFALVEIIIFIAMVFIFGFSKEERNNFRKIVHRQV